MSSAPNPDLDFLVAHDAGIRRLARRLAGDEDRGDDLAQETWLSALRSKWNQKTSARLFLSGVLRNRAVHAQRTDGRRIQHEASAEPSAVEPSVAERLERAELGRELTRLLLDLEEPFRTVVLLKVQEDMPSSAIARQLGVSMKTVESRLARGLARLRERWKRSHPSDARTWLAALAGLPSLELFPLLPKASAASTSGATASTLGALIISTKALAILITVAGSGALACLALIAFSSEQEPLASNTSAAESAAPTIQSAQPVASAQPVSSERVALAQTSEESEIIASAAIEALPVQVLGVLSGRVVDPDGNSLSALMVVLSEDGKERARTFSDVSGNFELPAPRAAGRVRIEEADYEELFALTVRPGSVGNRLLLVAARHRILEGYVVDQDDWPISDALVELEPPAGFRSRFDVVLDDANQREWRTTTDREGRFEFERVPEITGNRLVARLDGYEAAALSPPNGSSSGLKLVLRRAESNENNIVGRVLDEGGAPVKGALVSLGSHVSTTGRDGSFKLDRRFGEDSTELTAVFAGHLPAREQAILNSATGEPIWPDWVELILGGVPLELAGRVVDEYGEPLPNFHLWIDDPTRFGIVDEDLDVQLENLVAPKPSTYDESSDDYFRWTATDAEGRFRIQGLLDRPYRIGVLDPDGASTSRHGPFEAGRTNLTIQINRPQPRRVSGRITSRNGASMEGVRVTLCAKMFRGVSDEHSKVTTDIEGRFSFDGIRGSELALWLRGDFVLPGIYTIDWPADEEGLVVVDALCHLKVELVSNPGSADEIMVVDSGGEALSLYELGTHGYTQHGTWELFEGRSITLGVPDSARELILYKQGEEVRRFQLSLQPGRIEILRD